MSDFKASLELQLILNQCEERCDQLVFDWKSNQGTSFLDYVTNDDEASNDWAQILEDAADGFSKQECRLILFEMAGSEFEERVNSSYCKKGDIHSLNEWATCLVASYLEKVFTAKYPQWNVAWWG